jgi:hypothetical protein
MIITLLDCLFHFSFFLCFFLQYFFSSIYPSTYLLPSPQTLPWRWQLQCSPKRWKTSDTRRDLLPKAIDSVREYLRVCLSARQSVCPSPEVRWYANAILLNPLNYRTPILDCYCCYYYYDQFYFNMLTQQLRQPITEPAQDNDKSTKNRKHIKLRLCIINRSIQSNAIQLILFLFLRADSTAKKSQLQSAQENNICKKIFLCIF